MQDKDITHAHHSKIEKLASESRTSTSELSFNWVKRLLHRAPIRRKIGLGYTLALGIAVLGTTTGQLVGDFYTKQASQKLNLEQNEAQLLSKLKIAVVETQSHQQKLVILISDLEQFEHEKFEYLEQKKQVKQLFAKLTFIVGKNSDKSDIEIIDLEKFLKTYNTTHANYNQQLDKILQRIAPKTLQPEKVTAAQKLLWDFTKSDVSVQFNQLSEDLTKLVELAYEGQDRAETALYQAQVLNIQITIASLLLSIAIATASVFYTSRTISYPLEAVTQVAKKATQEFNFNLQAPVTTQDEVGVLATSLNSLIKWVAEYIQELELARANLEKRVEERTEELSQKNQQLQSAHDQLKAVLQNLQKTQAQLIQAEKMSSLGQMVAGIAHEINNPVSFIYSNLEHVQNYTQDLLKLVQIYQQQCPKPNAAIQDETEAIELDFLADDLPKTLDSMQRGAERISQIVLSLRNFSRLDESETKPANIHEGIDNALLILNHRLHFHILLVNEEIKIIKLYNDLPKIECYPALLNQVFMNILNNAIDALEEARNKTAAVDNFSPTIWIHTETVDANYIKVRIQNNGTGIPPKLKDKLFDPFFTTKDVGKGTGLGLAICYQIIEKHGGKIEVISEPGLLTEFAIALPVKQSFQ